MSPDPLGVAALIALSLEWLGLGWLSGVRLGGSGAPSPLRATATWSVRLLVGAWLVGVAALLLAFTPLGFGSIPLVLLVAAAAACGVRVVAMRLGPMSACSNTLEQLTGRETAGWLLLGVVLAAAVVRAFSVPEAGWDAYSHWGLRAQAFATAGTLVNAGSEHEYYPPLIPLLEAWLDLHRGLTSIDLAKTVWPMLGAAFAVCLGWHLRLALGARWLAPYAALGVVLATPGLLEGFWTGQADLALTVYLTLATLAAWQWQQTAQRGWLLQAAVFAAATALCKFEGLPRIALVVAALALDNVLSRCWRHVAVTSIALLLPALGAALVWTAFQLSHAIPANAEHVGAFQPLAIGAVLVALVGVFAGVRTGGGLLVAAATWALSARAVLTPPLRALALVVLAQAVGTLMAFLVSSTAPDVEVMTSATRLLEQFLPLALFVGVIGLARVGNL